MKKAILCTVMVTLLAGCTSRTQFGECVGLADDKKPDLTYKVSAWNISLGILFIETIIVPVFVAVDETYCPVAKKQ